MHQCADVLMAECSFVIRQDLYQDICLMGGFDISETYRLCFGCYVCHRVLLTFPPCQVRKTDQQICCSPSAQALTVHVSAHADAHDMLSCSMRSWGRNDNSKA